MYDDVCICMYISMNTHTNIYIYIYAYDQSRTVKPFFGEVDRLILKEPGFMNQGLALIGFYKLLSDNC